MKEKEVYQFYNNYVKVLYSEIEARNNTIPVELLFEIHSAFDHLKRIYIDNESEDECCKKAFSHLKRGVLDAFKLKLKYFNVEYEALIHKRCDLRIIDSGTYLSNLLMDHKKIVEIAKMARLNESKKDIEASFENWCIVSELIETFQNNYFDSAKIKWAEKQSLFHFSANFWVGVISGIVATIIVQVINYYLK